MNRRTFVTAAGALVASATPARAARPAPLLRGGQFSEGVLSGDPTPTGITLSTRLVGVEGPGTVGLEIARDKGFDHIVARARLQTDPSLGHVVKARVDKLKPHTRYWYRFSGRTAHSGVGRFRTAPPAGSDQVVQFGVVYGFEYTSGYFNAAGRLAEEDLDFVLNLGNYVCADQALTGPDAVRELATAAPAQTLAAYRSLYRTYRTDADLRRLHAALPFVSTWDDGEVATGYAGTDIANARKKAAYRAWFEAMPHYPTQAGVARVYHQPHISRLLQLFVCDTRHYRRPAPSDSLVGLLGSRQSRQLRSALKGSQARWKVVASPAPLTETADGWAGYQRELDELLAVIELRGVDDVVFLSGGRRRFSASNVANRNGKAIAPEFGVATVSQRSGADDDGSGHGYSVLSVASDLLTVRHQPVATVRGDYALPLSPVVVELKPGAKLPDGA